MTMTQPITAPFTAIAPRVTVIIPAHRRPDLLRKLLDSLEIQSLPGERFEVIVVTSENDASTPLVDEFRQRGRIDIRATTVPNDPWKGRSASAKRNYGASLARGQWLAFVDDDCIADANWLAGASSLFDQPTAGGIEGCKSIPAPPRPTLTYKGLLNFTRPKGYQTCNIFYRKDVFDKVGGFDPKFPYYLEDSDIAWSVLDAGFEIPFAQNAVVAHPVLPPAPWKLLDDAKRSVLMPYLFKKHPHKYRDSGTQVVRGGHLIYLFAYAALIAFLIAGWWITSIGIVAGVVLMTLAHTFKLFRGCAVTVNEVVVTALLLPVVPVVKWAGLWRGNLRHGVWLWR